MHFNYINYHQVSAVMGIPTCRFLDPKHEQFVCVICLDVAEDPVVITGCEHIFCRTCVDKVGLSKCPSCREPFIEPRWTGLGAALKRSYLDLKIRCLNPSCKQNLDVDSFADHDSNCPITFKFCNECGDKARRVSDEQHSCIASLRTKYLEIKSGMDKQIAEAKRRQVDADEKKRREFRFGLAVVLVSIVICSYLINLKFSQLEDHYEGKLEQLKEKMERKIEQKMATENEEQLKNILLIVDQKLADMERKLTEAGADMAMVMMAEQNISDVKEEQLKNKLEIDKKCAEMEEIMKTIADDVMKERQQMEEKWTQQADKIEHHYHSKLEQLKEEMEQKMVRVNEQLDETEEKLKKERQRYEDIIAPRCLCQEWI